jgi:hypothetical protein
MTDTTPEAVHTALMNVSSGIINLADLAVLTARVTELEAENVRLRELLSGFYASQDIEDALR